MDDIANESGNLKFIEMIVKDFTNYGRENGSNHDYILKFLEDGTYLKARSTKLGTEICLI